MEQSPMYSIPFSLSMALTLKRATAVFAEKLERLQQTMLHKPESQS
jgi:hypothetical protein